MKQGILALLFLPEVGKDIVHIRHGGHIGIPMHEADQRNLGLQLVLPDSGAVFCQGDGGNGVVLGQTMFGKVLFLHPIWDHHKMVVRDNVKIDYILRFFTFCRTVDIMVKTTIFDKEIKDHMNTKEILDLLYRIDDGYCPTKDECRFLRNVPILNISGAEGLRNELPASMHYLEHLEEIRIRGTNSISSLEPLSKIKTLKSICFWDGASITDISALEKNINLEELDLSDAPISDISALAKLRNVKKIRLRSTQITDISPLSNLANLKEVNISNTGVTSIAPLTTLPKLERLVIYDTPIDDFFLLSEMQQLRELATDHMETCNPEFGQWISQVTRLVLNHSPITDLESLFPCTKLEHLWLISTDVHILPTWLGERMPLRHLLLWYQDLHDIPSSLMNLNLPFRKDFFTRDLGEEGIYLENTTLAVQPISLFEQEREFIQAYYDSEKVPINESKVIFLGDGGVGKTHTIKRILNNDKQDDYKTETTPGIDITHYPVEYEGRRFHIHFWDFGGQEIMHAMHRCFLTERTCYVVVLSNRADSDLTARARYWLRNIQSFAPKAKVLLALNRWDDIAAGGIDMSRLLSEYNNLCPEPVHFSAKNSSDEDFGLLTRAIIREAAALDSSAMEFPLPWANIRQKLLDSAQTRHYIDKDDYHRFCAEEGLEAPNIRTWLLEWFNDLGVCFSYHQEKDGTDQPTELDAYKVLNPRWLTNAIYILINHGRDYAENGKLHRNNIRDLLNNSNLGVLKGVAYSSNERKYVLDVMRKFTLSYEVSGTHEFIPALCDPNTPKNLHPTNYHRHVSYQMEYTFLPDSVIHQLMIRCYDNLNFAMLWRKGMRLDIDFAGLCAVVDMGNDDCTLRIDVYGSSDSQPWKLLQHLRTHISEINRSLGLSSEDSVIVCDDGYEETISIDQLLCAKEEHDPYIKIFNKAKKRNFRCDVNELLDLTFGETAMIKAQELAKEKQVPVVNVFNDCTFGSVNFNQQTTDMDYLNLIHILIEKQAQLDSEVITSLINALEKSDDEDLKKIAIESEKEPRKGILTRLKDLLDTTGSIAENGEKVYKAGKAIVLALTPHIPTIMQKIPEAMEYLKQLPIGGG